MFSNQRDSTLGLLILRHLLEDEFIEYPLPSDKPHAQIFHILERNGFIERWDRIWPLTDRYRLTARGKQAIESTYRPAQAAQVMQQLQARKLPPNARPQGLQQLGFDPTLWPILHDPKVHWMTWPQMIGPYQSYVWEAAIAAARPAQGQAPARAGSQPARAGRAPAGAPRAVASPPPRVAPPIQHYSHHVDPDPFFFSSGYSDYGHHHHHGSSDSGSTWEPFQGGAGESGGGGSSGSYDTDDLDRGGSGTDASSEGSSYGDAS